MNVVLGCPVEGDQNLFRPATPREPETSKEEAGGHDFEEMSAGPGICRFASCCRKLIVEPGAEFFSFNHVVETAPELTTGGSVRS
ncbi:MAG: hypothetical protein LR011_13255 [Verrucomicrobia bacterium]|nr:hypothetical protein [Verrucomicrobiota bacterium]